MMNTDNIKVIRSALLSPHHDLRFGISTRCGGVSPSPYDLNLSFKVGDAEENVIQNRKRFFNRIGVSLDRLAIPDQVHGSNVVCISAPGRYNACDGLTTCDDNVFLAVTIADCVPVFLFDREKKAVAVIHAGWRGSKLNILKHSVSLMIGKYGSDASHILAYIGPSAGACCYEIGNEIAEEFDDIYILHRSGKSSHLDMKAVQVDNLLAAGLKITNIEVSQYCTICRPDLFHSYRRNGQQSGRMMGVIGITA